MAFRRLLPYAAVSTVSGLSGAAGWFLKEKDVERQVHSNPGPFIEKIAHSAKDPAKVFAAVAVQAVNRSGKLGMAGANYTDELSSGVTRRSISVNVYSRIAASATVAAFREEDNGLEVLLITNKRKPGRLFSAEGFGKFAPLKNTGTYFSDLKSPDKDTAEELVLKDVRVDESYQKVAAEKGSGKYGYGPWDFTFKDTSKREFHEETGLVPGEFTRIYDEIEYSEKWCLQTYVTGFFTVLHGDVESLFVPDETEVASIHMIKIADIEVVADGSGKVKGFKEIIPVHCMGRFEKSIIAYEEMQLTKISGGLITTVAELEIYAKKAGRECPKLILFGPEQPASSQAFRDFARNMVASLDAALGCTPFLKAGSSLPAPEKDSKSELTS